jgi:hypothetical protein
MTGYRKFVFPRGDGATIATTATKDQSVAKVAAVAPIPSKNKDFESHSPPRIVKDPHFGCDSVPARYASAWEALLSQCPAGVNPVVWEGAIYDSADLFGVWGAELDRLRWTPGDLFDVPHDDKSGGLAWFLRREHVIALGPQRAFMEVGRVFDRKRR